MAKKIIGFDALTEYDSKIKEVIQEGVVQYSTMPEASEDIENKVIQYTGITNLDYTNGYFYKNIGTPGAIVNLTERKARSGINKFILPTSFTLDHAPVEDPEDVFYITLSDGSDTEVTVEAQTDSDFYAITVSIDRPTGDHIFVPYYSTLEDGLEYETAYIEEDTEYTFETPLTLQDDWYDFVGPVLLQEGKSYSWENIEIQDHQSLDNYLAKNNTTSYSPSGDYNPATKKYVDDSINVGLDFVRVTSSNKNDADIIAAVNKQLENYFDGKDFNIYLEVLSGDMRYLGLRRVTSIKISGAECVLSTDWVDSNTSGSAGEILGILRASCVYDGSTQTISEITYVDGGMAFTIATSGSTFNPASDTQIVTSKVLANNVLAKNNTTAYTPTGDYNPATKKYIDDLLGTLQSVANEILNGTESGGE